MEELKGRDEWEYDNFIKIEWIDIFSTIVAAIIVIFLAFLYKNKKLDDPAYKFYMPGLGAKILGGMVYCSIYLFYYGYGDTIAYFESTNAMANLFYMDPTKYFEVMISEPSVEIRSLFTDRTGYPYGYMFYDSHTFMVIKLTSIFTILTGKSYFLTSLILACLSFYGLWKLFLMFRQYAPEIETKLAWAILFFPSPLFWGGGVSKDTFTYSATALFVYCAHEFFIMKKRKAVIVLLLLFSSWLILTIKPYIFLVLFPGGLFWIFYNQLQRIKSPFVSFILFPLVIIGVSFLSYYVLGSLSSSMSKFSVDKAFETAASTNHDLKQEYYGGSSFDIGDYDGTAAGMLPLFFPAINAGLFRPFLWEGRSLVLFAAALENAFLLGFTIYILFQTRFKGAFKIIAKNPLLLFCVMFSILFAFMIGLTTSNFGALVRFKIPIIPFFLATLFIIDHIRKIRWRDDL
jgi:hypothetical protein